MFIFHIVFWLLSVVFAVQLFQIRQNQKDLFKRDSYTTRRIISRDVDSQYLQRELDSRLNKIEENLEKLFQMIKDDRNR
jgi:hypothetical protein